MGMTTLASDYWRPGETRALFNYCPSSFTRILQQYPSRFGYIQGGYAARSSQVSKGKVLEVFTDALRAFEGDSTRLAYDIIDGKAKFLTVAEAGKLLGRTPYPLRLILGKGEFPFPHLERFPFTEKHSYSILREPLEQHLARVMGVSDPSTLVRKLLGEEDRWLRSGDVMTYLYASRKELREIPHQELPGYFLIPGISQRHYLESHVRSFKRNGRYL